MEHRGKIIRNRVNEFGVKHNFVYKKLGITKPTWTTLLKTHNPDKDVIRRIGRIIRFNFHTDFLDVEPIVIDFGSPVSIAAEPQAAYSPSQFAAIMQELAEVKQAVKDLLKP